MQPDNKNLLWVYNELHCTAQALHFDFNSVFCIAYMYKVANLRPGTAQS